MKKLILVFSVLSLSLMSQAQETKRLIKRTNIKLPIAVGNCSTMVNGEILDNTKTRVTSQFPVTYCVKYQEYTAEVSKGNFWNTIETNPRDVQDSWQVESEIESVNNGFNNAVSSKDDTLGGAVLNALSGVNVLAQCNQRRELFVQNINANRAAGSANPCAR
jgi:hypothetical protein